MSTLRAPAQPVHLAAGQRRLSRIGRRLLRPTIAQVLILLGSILFLVPLVWMVSASFKTMEQAYAFPPEWIPRPFLLTPYIEGFAAYPFLTFYKNTVIITGLSVIGTVCSSSVVAFGFARLRFRGRDFLFLVLLCTMMLPSQVTMIPLYIGYAHVGWINTYWPLVLPTFFGHPFYVFLLRQFFLTLPLDLDDAAKIDGASYFAIFRRICLPLAKPAIAAVAIFMFIFQWNDFVLPLIYLQNQDMWTVAVGLSQFNTSTYQNLPSLMAMSTLAIVPEIVIFFFAQKHFVQGVVLSGIKG